MSFDSIRSLGTLPLDCSQHHAIIFGTNAIDYFGSDSSEERKNQVFETLEKFVSSGGHLFMFGSFNGRNAERLKIFGIHTGFVHNDYFRPVPGRTEVLFRGSENLIPAPAKIRSYGNFAIDEDRISVVMLRRGTAGDSGEEGAEQDPESPVLATLVYGRGRVSYSPTEPSANGLWLVPIAVNWIARGAPTNLEQLETEVVVSKSLLRSKNSNSSKSFPQETLQAIETELVQQFSAELASLDSSDSELQFATALREAAKVEESLAKRFVLTKLAWQHMAAGGDVMTASTILSDATDRYSFDRITAQLELLPTIEKVSAATADLATLERLLRWADDAEVEHRYIEAELFTELAKRIADLSDEPSLKKAIHTRVEFLKPLVIAQKEVLSDIERPRQSVLDADAKSRLGRFYALSCGDWELGLPLIAEGSHEALRKCAELDLKSPSTATAQVALAELWSSVLDEASELQILATKKRSRYWYRKALPYLVGDENAKTEAKIADLQLPRIEWTFLLQLDGSGRLEISREGISWTDLYGVPVDLIRVNSQRWSLGDADVFPNRAAAQFVPERTALEYPRVRRVTGRGLVALERNAGGRIVVNLNDVPEGADFYEFVIDVVR
ncbi:hypothetical protein [Novipirellula sp.]|uniref:hypothetical protein n=1 Tax=Novipirellula sp. TaxID=2795430 RepID=UPI0035658025